MEKDYEIMLNSMIAYLVEEFNDFSRLVSMNYSQGAHDDIAEWNRAKRSAARDHLEHLAMQADVSIDYKTVEEIYCGYKLEYLVVQ